MVIQRWSERVLLAFLPQESEKPRLGDELQDLFQQIRAVEPDAVVMDFSYIDFITASSISILLGMRKHLEGQGGRLVFCGVSPAIKGLFTLMGIDSLFEIAKDRHAILATHTTEF